MIASIIPYVAVGNKFPLLLPQNCAENDGAERSYDIWGPLILANLNSFAFDFVTRQKIQGQTLNLFILEQLPILPADSYCNHIGEVHMSDLVRREVLKLTYTASDLEPFAQDMGYHGDPFPWDEEERRHSRARLDALYFLLYGLGRDDAAYIMDTFPIVRKQDVDAFGRYLTKEMVLAYMAAFEAGDTESRVVAEGL